MSASDHALCTSYVRRCCFAPCCFATRSVYLLIFQPTSFLHPTDLAPRIVLTALPYSCGPFAAPAEQRVNHWAMNPG